MGFNSTNAGVGGYNGSPGGVNGDGVSEGTVVTGWAPGEREAKSDGRGFTDAQVAAAKHGLSIGAYDVRSAFNQREGALSQARAEESRKRAMRSKLRAMGKYNNYLTDERTASKLKDHYKIENTGRWHQYGTPMQRFEKYETPKYAVDTRKGMLAYGQAISALNKGDLKTYEKAVSALHNGKNVPAASRKTGNYFSGFLGEIGNVLGFGVGADNIESIQEIRSGLVKNGVIEKTNPYTGRLAETLPTEYNRLANRQWAYDLDPNLAQAFDNKYVDSLSHLTDAGKYNAKQALRARDYDTFMDLTTDFKGGQSLTAAREPLSFFSKGEQNGGLLSGVFSKDKDKDTNPYDDDVEQVSEAISLANQPMTAARMLGEYQGKGTGFVSPTGMFLGMLHHPVAKNAGGLVYDQTKNPGLAIGIAQSADAIAKKASESAQPVDYGNWDVNADFGDSRFGKYASQGLNKVTNAIPGLAMSATGIPVASQIGQLIGMLNTASNLNALGITVPHEKVYSEHIGKDADENKYLSIQPRQTGLLAAPRLTYDQVMAGSYASPWWARAI